jgi:hypothetical protein
MPKLLVPLIGMAALSAAALFVPRAEATLSAAAPSIIGATVGGAHSAVEPAATVCERRRVCRPGAGCAWRTVCKRLPSKAPGTMRSPGTMGGPGMM